MLVTSCCGGGASSDATKEESGGGEAASRRAWLRTSSFILWDGFFEGWGEREEPPSSTAFKSNTKHLNIISIDGG